MQKWVSCTVSALVASFYWSRATGGVLVSAGFVKSFEFLGLDPVIGSVVKADVSGFPEWFGIDLSRYPRVDLGLSLGRFSLFMRLLVGYVIRKALKGHPIRVVYTDSPMYKRVVNEVRKKGIKLIEYIHFPVEAVFRREFLETGVFYGDASLVSGRYDRFPYNIYYGLYLKLVPFFMRDNPFDVAHLVLTNSRWTAQVAKAVYGEEPEVLNPPIAPNVEVVENPKPFDSRSNVVVMVGRFTEEKRYHWVIQELFPKLRKVIGNAKLFIFGSTGAKTAEEYYTKVFEIARMQGLRVSNTIDGDVDVWLVKNAPRSMINGVMDRTKVFLHATINEHWGIAVAEAMARGLPAVVHRSGGTWSDLVYEGGYGFGYTSADEAVEAIAKLMMDSATWRLYSQKAVERAKELTFGRFVEKAASLIKKIL
uniref:Glycosyltransferase n=1 Tax=Ignisphaera aggregans TaxID=334771 RepID=A0A7J2U5I8_9CREN